MLIETGELPGDQAETVRLHVESCATCQSVDAQTSQLMNLAGRVLPDEGPSAATLAAISDAASPTLQARVVPFPLSRMMSMAAALVALIAVIVLMNNALNAPDGSVVSVTTTTQPWVDALAADDDLQTTVALLSFVSDESDDLQELDLTAATSLSALADELLKMQGFDLYDDSYALN